MSVRGDIELNLSDRLRTITSANGYTTNVAKVFADEIPMGLDLDDFEMPAILVIPGKEVHNMLHQQLEAEWLFELQLVHGDVTDSVMHQFVRDVYKAIWADSPTEPRHRAFKFSPHVTHVLPGELETDLNMIEANRLWIITIVVHYRSKLTNL